MQCSPRIYINIACLGNAREVLSGILNRIKESGLDSASESLTLVVNGEEGFLSQEVVDLAQSMSCEVRWGRGPLTTHAFEFPTLDLLQSESQTMPPDTPVLYMHTKGVSRNSSVTVQDWTDMMLYFDVERWRDRLEELREHDCTGVNFGGSREDYEKDPSTWGYTSSPVCYSGNFWWSKASHLARLPLPSSCPPDSNWGRWRMYNEMWLCQLADASYHCCYHSGVNHYWVRHERHKYLIND
jgi:hypothetical protein